MKIDFSYLKSYSSYDDVGLDERTKNAIINGFANLKGIDWLFENGFAHYEKDKNGDYIYDIKKILEYLSSEKINVTRFRGIGKKSINNLIEIGIK